MVYSELWNKHNTISLKCVHELLQKCTYILTLPSIQRYTSRLIFSKMRWVTHLRRDVMYFECVQKYTSEFEIFFLKFYKDDSSLLRVWRETILFFLEVILWSPSNIMRKITFVTHSFIRDLFFKPYNQKLYFKIFKSSKISPSYSIIVLQLFSLVIQSICIFDIINLIIILNYK